jgi:hypothetical protein
MIEATSKGCAAAYLNDCTNFFDAKASPESGGALAVFASANCYCTDCRLFGNKAGGLLFTVRCG